PRLRRLPPRASLGGGQAPPAVPRRERTQPAARARRRRLRRLVRALVTGAAGFVGANLVRRLLVDGHEVHAVVRPGGDRWRLSDVADVRVAEADLRDAGAVGAVITGARPTAVSPPGPRGASGGRAAARAPREASVRGAASALGACARGGGGGFVNPAPSREYALKAPPPAETEPLEPTSVYGVA